MPICPWSRRLRLGLEIDFEAIKRTPNTLDAHRLIHWAGIEGRQTAAVSKLFKAISMKGGILAIRPRSPPSPVRSAWTRHGYAPIDQ